MGTGFGNAFRWGSAEEQESIGHVKRGRADYIIRSFTILVDRT